MRFSLPFVIKSRSVLMTEFGGPSSGDQALCAAAARRLHSAGIRTTLLANRALTEAAHLHAMHVRRVDFSPLDTLSDVTSLKQLTSEFQRRVPGGMHEILKSFERADAVVVAPGGRLMDGYPIARNLLVTALAIENGIPVVNLHQSVGPIESPHIRAMVREALLQSALTVTRDDISFAFLRELGIPEARVFPARDLVFAESYPAPGAIQFDLGVNVRFGFNGHAKADVLKLFLREYLRQKPSARVLVYTTSNPFTPDQTEALEDIPCTVESAPPVQPDFLRAIGRCAVNVSDSFHGVVFSMLARRPVVALQPDFESWKLHGTLVPGQSPMEVLPGFVDAPAARAVLDRVLEVQADPTPVQERQSRFVEHCRRRAEDGWQRVESVLRSV